MINLNGQPIEVDLKKGKIKDLLKKLELYEEQVVVLKNGEIVTSGDYFNEEDEIEILEATSRG